MPVLIGPPRRRARDRISVEPVRDRPITVAVEVLGEDPPHHLSRWFVDHQHPQPEALGRLAWVRVRPGVDDDVPVRCPAALVASLVDHLDVHRGPHPSLYVLALGLAHPAEHAHQHLVRRVTRVVHAAELRNPQFNAVRLESRSDQRELIAEPATRAFPDNHGVPAPPGIFQRREQLRSCRPPVPRDGSRLPDVEELFDDRTATRTDELARRSRAARRATSSGLDCPPSNSDRRRPLRSLLIGQVFDAADSDQFIENRPRVIGRGGHRVPLGL